MNGDPPKVALIVDHPAQQFGRALQLLAEREDVRLQVYYWNVASELYDPGFDRSISWDVELLGGYLWDAPASGCSAVGHVRWLARCLRAARPDVVICYGWASRIARVSIAYCTLTRTPLLMYGDTTWQHSSRGRRRLARSAAAHLLMRVCSGAVATGTFNREFYIRHGMNPRQIWPGVCPADTETFGEARTGDHGTPDRDNSPLRIGFAGKLIPRKGADVLLQALALIPVIWPWSLTIVGDGPLMPKLQALAAELGIGDRITFHGFANTTEMPKLLAGLDVVVVPSRLDMRVLVTIEAMAAGAVVVVSDATAVWGPGDLVQEGVTGLIHASDDPADLARQLSRLLDDRELLAALRRNGIKRVADFGPEAFARSTAAAARGCVESRGAELSLGSALRLGHDD